MAGTVYAAMGLGILNKFLEGWAGAVLAKIAIGDPVTVHCDGCKADVPAKVTFDGYGTTTASGTVVMQMGGYKRVLTMNPSTGQAAITNN